MVVWEEVEDEVCGRGDFEDEFATQVCVLCSQIWLKGMWEKKKNLGLIDLLPKITGENITLWCLVLVSFEILDESGSDFVTDGDE